MKFKLTAQGYFEGKNPPSGGKPLSGFDIKTTSDTNIKKLVMPVRSSR